MDRRLLLLPSSLFFDAFSVLPDRAHHKAHYASPYRLRHRVAHCVLGRGCGLSARLSMRSSETLGHRAAQSVHPPCTDSNAHCVCSKLIGFVVDCIQSQSNLKGSPRTRQHCGCRRSALECQDALESKSHRISGILDTTSACKVLI